MLTKVVIKTGPTMLLVGAAVLPTTVAVVLLAGYYILKVPFERSGCGGFGCNGNSSHSRLFDGNAPTERPDIGYAMIYPSMTIAKVIAVQIAGLLAAAGGGG